MTPHDEARAFLATLPPSLRFIDLQPDGYLVKIDGQWFAASVKDILEALAYWMKRGRP